ncbi:MAG: phosphomannomutase [Acidobacteriota bacterium]
MPLKFGTSGVRGLVSEMTDFECWLFTRAFVRHLRAQHPADRIGISGDLRSSTPRILRAVGLGLEDEGIETVCFGRVPTPALCLYGLSHGIPTIMVTGSHIPEDRNGIKFNLATGEILKQDEEGILQRYGELKERRRLPFPPFADDGLLEAARPDLPGAVDDSAAEEYLERYFEFFPRQALAGLRVGVYQHSGVGRDLLCSLLVGLGADVRAFGRSDSFVAVDTEAVEEPERLASWVHEFELDALVSTDGDADRPLLVSDRGGIIHGDILGTLVSDYLDADAVVLPVSCNTAIERWNRFPNVRRTRIGSPYVISGMLEAIEEGRSRIVGFEANGGFLIASEIPAPSGGRPLRPLPTRDAAFPLLAALHMAQRQHVRVSDLASRLPARFTYSGLLRRFPGEIGQAIITSIRRQGPPLVQEFFGNTLGEVSNIDFTDGARITFKNDEIVHFRPSGNAPEFRCYTEADSEERACTINLLAMEVLTSRLRPGAEQNG